MADRQRRLLLVLVLVVVFLISGATGASAACHRFELDVSDTSPDEGDTVTVTVSRDGAIDDSGVRVTSTDGSARSGADFTALNQQVNFTGTSTERSFQIRIAGDEVAEPAESFTVGLSQPSGCAVNPNFSLAGPVTVRINASEGSTSPAPQPPPPPAPAPAPPPPPAPAPAPASPTQPAETPSPTAEASPEPTESPSPLETPLGDDSDDGGVAPQLIIGLLALAGAGGVGYYLWSQRRSVPPEI